MALTIIGTWKFSVVKRIIEKITGEEAEYKSPTDMGVNRVDSAL